MIPKIPDRVFRKLAINALRYCVSYYSRKHIDDLSKRLKTSFEHQTKTKPSNDK